MKVGDKVRFVHGKESGWITRVIDSVQVEVEIEDGFRIPVAKKELALISEQEVRMTTAGDDTSSPYATTPALTLSGTLQIAFQAFNDKTHKVYLINEHNCDVLFSCYKKDTGYTLFHSGKIDKGSVFPIDEWLIQDFAKWPTLSFQFIYLLKKTDQIQAPALIEVAVKAEKFHKNRKQHALLKGEAHFWPIDSDLKITEKHLEKLSVAMNTSSAGKEEIMSFEEPDYETDLHIEKLEEDWQRMSPVQMLNLQISVFEKILDRAIATGMAELIFIHGVGNNTLKNELHKRLSKDKRIAYFKDARKDRFGFGATLVRISE